MEGIIIYSVIAVIAVTILVINILRFRYRQRRDLARLADADIGNPAAQHPQIDESLCVGCGSCVAACPEGDVLGIVYGKAKMLNPLRCVGHGACASACPVGAIPPSRERGLKGRSFPPSPPKGERVGVRGGNYCSIFDVKLL